MNSNSTSLGGGGGGSANSAVRGQSLQSQGHSKIQESMWGNYMMLQFNFELVVHAHLQLHYF